MRSFLPLLARASPPPPPPSGLRFHRPGPLLTEAEGESVANGASRLSSLPRAEECCRPDLVARLSVEESAGQISPQVEIKVSAGPHLREWKGAFVDVES